MPKVFMTPEQRKLVEAHLQTARRAVRRCASMHLHDELEGVAFEALCKAAIEYTSRPCAVPFRVHASGRCKGAVLNAADRWLRLHALSLDLLLDHGDWWYPSCLRAEDPADAVVASLSPTAVIGGVEYWEPTCAPYAWVDAPLEPLEPAAPRHLRIAS